MKKKKTKRGLVIKIRADSNHLKDMKQGLEDLLEQTGLILHKNSFKLIGNSLILSLNLYTKQIDPFLSAFSEMLEVILRQRSAPDEEAEIEISDAGALECQGQTIIHLENGWKIRVVPDHFDPADHLEPPAPDTVLIKTGWAFGSGRHPSTQGAVSALDHLYRLGVMQNARVLDVGTGTGLLALLAGKMGAAQVVGVDIDQQARETAMENLRLNRLSDRLKILPCIDALNLKKQDVIVANLTPSVLSGLIDTLVDILAANGFLLLSGYPSGARDRVENMLKSRGMEVFYSLEKQGWATEIFCFIRSKI